MGDELKPVTDVSRETPRQLPPPEPPQQPKFPANGAFNPPLEKVQVTRGRRGGLAFIVNGKRTDDPG